MTPNYVRQSRQRSSCLVHQRKAAAHSGSCVCRTTSFFTVTEAEIMEAVGILDRAFAFIMAGQPDRSVMPVARF
jgi:hypothetical protein